MTIRTAALCLAGALAGILAASAVSATAVAQEANSSTRTGQSEVSLASGTTIKAELNTSIDSKKVKPGDSVVAHTTEALKSADDRTILPRGTKLMGHVTQASARSKGDQESALGLSFDRAILKGGEEIPLNTTIQAVAAPESIAVSRAYAEGGPYQGGTASGPANSPTAGGGSTGMQGNRGGRPESNYPGSYPRTDTGNPEPGATEMAPNMRGVYGISGLRLSTTSENNAPVSVLSSAGKNVRLEGGTRLLLVTQTAASQAAAQ